MAKDRKKPRKRKPATQQSRPATIHRYSAETEDKRDKRKKLKLKAIVSLIALGLGLGIGLLINFLIF